MTTSPTQKQVEEAKKVLEQHEKREKELAYVKRELAFRLSKFTQVKFNVRKKERVIVFAGLHETGDLKLAISKQVSSDQWDENIGKLIAVKRALKEDISDVVELVEPKVNLGGLFTGTGMRLFETDLAKLEYDFK
ncbi:hypothetical protein [Halobacillus litoralis]|uniref:hypothetical protein n=1 Tax=Halobacillus litoralis TaxID=45668 RepID=UPI001CD31789|nr:hypothetical protein [Halobacillus litoralis]MCA1021490.1 hypothetical protein [Halobacillus litoralis]